MARIPRVIRVATKQVSFGSKLHVLLKQRHGVRDSDKTTKGIRDLNTRLPCFVHVCSFAFASLIYQNMFNFNSFLTGIYIV